VEYYAKSVFGSWAPVFLLFKKIHIYFEKI
jgi:hypothetical protein